jgi:hypothetical protein
MNADLIVETPDEQQQIITQQRELLDNKDLLLLILERQDLILELLKKMSLDSKPY